MRVIPCKTITDAFVCAANDSGPNPISPDEGSTALVGRHHGDEVVSEGRELAFPFPETKEKIFSLSVAWIAVSRRLVDAIVQGDEMKRFLLAGAPEMHRGL